ncbi:hypothetical protein J6590_029680 [Homalodisca vitripennis]|nr:hypothetical protein J6590_029680 [Homalodisca vitripennis]
MKLRESPGDIISFHLTHDDGCWYCVEVDSAYHTFLCQQWEEERELLKNFTSNHQLAPDTIVLHILKNEDTWNATRKFVHDILQKEIKDERLRGGL